MNIFKLLFFKIIIFQFIFPLQGQSLHKNKFHNLINFSDTLLSKEGKINEIELLKYIDSKKSYSDIKIEIQRIKNSVDTKIITN